MNTDELKSREYHEEQKRIEEYIQAKKKKQSYKILFLDIDGVIAPFRSRGLNSDCLLLLKRIVKETGCKIVLSSTWRWFPSSRKLIDTKLIEMDCDPLIDITPTLSKVQFTRVDEILAWMSSSTENGNVIENWVAIDDMELQKDHRMTGHFVLTNCDVGMTKEDADKVIQILNKTQ